MLHCFSWNKKVKYILRGFSIILPMQLEEKNKVQIFNCVITTAS